MPTDVTGSIEALEERLGALLSQHKRKTAPDAFTPYRDDPAGFLGAVLKTNLWSKQVAICESVRDNRLTLVQGCNGSGKDYTAGGLALWWAQARGGLTILSGPTDRQVTEVCMRREVRRHFSRARRLPGELYERALRIPDHPTAGILAFTATNPDAFTGHHSPGGVLVVLTEAQGIEPEIFESALALTTGEHDRVLVLCNPLCPTGKAYDIAHSEHWHRIEMPAGEHPNVTEGREVIPGAVTRAFVDQIRTEYGVDSPQYRARVLAEWPTEDSEQLIKREWIDRAVEQWQIARRNGFPGAPTLALDVACQGPDRLVLGVARGNAVMKLVSWRGDDTVAACDRVESEAKKAAGVASRPKTIVDATGLGWGHHDLLRARGWPVVAFVAAQSARDTERFKNARGEAAWLCREALAAGRFPLPPDPELGAELLAFTWGLDAQGRIELDSKDEVRAQLRRSPDLADVAFMLAWHLQPARINPPLNIRLDSEATAAPSQWRIPGVDSGLGRSTFDQSEDGFGATPLDLSRIAARIDRYRDGS